MRRVGRVRPAAVGERGAGDAGETETEERRDSDVAGREHGVTSRARGSTGPAVGRPAPGESDAWTLGGVAEATATCRCRYGDEPVNYRHRRAGGIQ
ncbi:hypothetical protein GCM10023221_23660 [Luteimicrobium xylanilyticum]